MACRFEGGTLKARAMVNDNKFVRVYGPTTEDQFSNPDDRMLLEWLKKNGYTKISGWSGFEIARIELPHSSDEILAPYLDGDATSGADQGNTILIGKRGEFELESQDGYISVETSHQGQVETEDGEWIDEDNATYISYGNHDGYVPSYQCVWLEYKEIDALKDDCNRLYDGEYGLDEDCVRLTAGEHRRFYALEEDTRELYDGEIALIGECEELYTGEYALYKECHELYNGQWALQEDCVELYNGKYGLKEDCVELHNGEYAPRDMCNGRNGEWYLSSEGGTPLFTKEELAGVGAGEHPYSQSKGHPYRQVHASRILRVRL